METIDLLAYLLVAVKILLIVVSVIFLLSGLDDLFIDLCFWVRQAYRRLVIRPRHAPIGVVQLQSIAEQPIAVMIPAWDESAVIAQMLNNTLEAVRYQNYRVFVGVYPNDRATWDTVQSVCRRYDRVVPIRGPHAGPSNKADCLNWIYQGIQNFEQQQHMRFEIFVMQDCEDVIDPLCYKLFNYLIPRKDMVQLPVLSLPAPWWQFTAGHYIDEFAQGHYKDMVVREWLNRSLPAAGVGCAFSRRAFDTVRAANGGDLFSLDSLTEDYDFGFRLKRLGLKQVFVKFPAPATRPARSGVVCVREYFPQHFRAAVRQKGRWVVGIALQAWATLGWRGDLATRYMFFRDRKALITNLANVGGYVVVLAVSLVWLAIWLDPDFYRYPPLLTRGSWLWYVVLANFALFAVRVLQRAYCVWRLYGWGQACLSTPRMVWGNVINFVATCRAIFLFARYLWTGKAIAWDKTAHRYPELTSADCRTPRLGELLLARRWLTQTELDDALARQRVDPRRLGELLCDMGIVAPRQVASALAAQT